ncbi:hypothetical protein N302_15143, partial [Corvus brachyrhynchos]
LWWLTSELHLPVSLSCSTFSDCLNSSSPGCLPVSGCLWAGLSILCKTLWASGFQSCQEY